MGTMVRRISRPLNPNPSEMIREEIHAHKHMSDIEECLQAIQSKDYRLAKAHCYKMLKKRPSDIGVMGLLASVEKALGNHEAAADLFEKTITGDPSRHDLLHNYAGLLKDRDISKARIFSERSVSLLPENAIYHERLGYICLLMKDLEAAKKHSLRALSIDPSLSSAQLNLGCAHQESGDYVEAYNATARFIEIRPEEPIGYLNMSCMLKEQGKLEEAEAMAIHALSLEKDSVDAIVNYGSVLKEQGRLSEALLALEKAARKSPGHCRTYYVAGTVLQALGELDKSIESFRVSLDIDDQSTDSLYELSRYIGSSEDAQVIIARSSNIDNALARPKDLVFLYFALSNAYHFQAEYQLSSQYLLKANNLKLSLMPSEASSLLETGTFSSSITRTKSSCLAQGADKTRIFIVGMPRSGSTLLETVLCTSPSTVDLGESNALQLAISELTSQSKKTDLHRSLEYFYDKHVNRISTAHKYTIDKQLYNYRLVHIIASAMPDAKIIHCKRNPLDNILSMYRSNLSFGNNYTSSLADAADVLASQEEIMAKNKLIFPEHIFTFDYDRFVKSPEETLQPLTQWLGLGWSEDYLYPERCSRVVNTASAIQARRPITPGSTGMWMNYREILETARKILIERSILNADN